MKKYPFSITLTIIALITLPLFIYLLPILIWLIIAGLLFAKFILKEDILSKIKSGNKGIYVLRPDYIKTFRLLNSN